MAGGNESDSTGKAVNDRLDMEEVGRRIRKLTWYQLVVGSVSLDILPTKQAFSDVAQVNLGQVDLRTIFVFGRVAQGLPLKDIEGIFAELGIPTSERIRTYLTAGDNQALSPREIINMMGALPEKTLRGLRDAGIDWGEIAEAVADSHSPLELLIDALSREGFGKERIVSFLAERFPESREAFVEARRFLSSHQLFDSDADVAAVRTFRENGTPLEILWEWSSAPKAIFAQGAIQACLESEDLTETLKFLHEKGLPLVQVVSNLRARRGPTPKGLPTAGNIEMLVAAGYTDIAEYRALPKGLIEWPEHGDQYELRQIGMIFSCAPGGPSGPAKVQLLSFLREHGFSARNALKLIITETEPLGCLQQLHLAGYSSDEVRSFEVRKLLGDKKTMTPRAFAKLWAQITPKTAEAPQVVTIEAAPSGEVKQEVSPGKHDDGDDN